MTTAPAPTTTGELRAPRRELSHAPSRPHLLVRGARDEGLWITVISALAFVVAGYLALTQGHLVMPDALDRLSRAYMVWWNDPPKLSAIGFGVAPMWTLLMLPLTLIKPLATSLVALPVISALAAGVTLAALNTILARCAFSRAIRYLILGLVAINPVFAFYATNGRPEIGALMLLSLALAGLVSWSLDGRIRHLAYAAAALAFGALVDYRIGLIALLIGIGAVRVQQARGATARRLESILILLLTPLVAALTIWMLVSAVIVDDPFAWLPSLPAPAPDEASSAVNAASAFGSVLEVTALVAPLALIAVPALLLGSRRADGARLSGWLALMIVVVACGPAVAALIAGDVGPLLISTGLVTAILAITGFAWLYRSVPDWRGMLAPLMIGALALAVILAWQGMREYPYQNQEQAFTRFVESGDSQEGTLAMGGLSVGVDPEVLMAERIEQIAGDSPRSILTDNTSTAGVILLTGKPELFVDRVGDGDGPWLRLLARPYGKVDYVLYATGVPDDLVAARFAGENGETVTIQPVFTTSRYVLARVAESPSQGFGAADSGVDVIETSPEQPATPGESAGAAPLGTSITSGSGAAPSSAGTSAPSIEGE